MTLPTPPRAGDLRVEAEKFANDWTNTVRAVVGAHVPPFVPVAKDTAVRAAVVVRQSGNDGIVLTVDSVPVLTLDASAHCIWDHRGSYLAVAESKFKVSAVGLASEPLFRYEFCRTPNRSPMAHLHVHAHRDAVTFVMTRCGGASKRGRRRLLDYDRGTKGNLPVMAHLHFPLGGSRFRPCLEDVLQMLTDEIGIDCLEGVDQALADGREQWRRMQIAASVRDSPRTVVQMLETLGYSVTPPQGGHPPDRPEQLRSI